MSSKDTHTDAIVTQTLDPQKHLWSSSAQGITAVSQRNGMEDGGQWNVDCDTKFGIRDMRMEDL